MNDGYMILRIYKKLYDYDDDDDDDDDFIWLII